MNERAEKFIGRFDPSLGDGAAGWQPIKTIPRDDTDALVWCHFEKFDGTVFDEGLRRKNESGHFDGIMRWVKWMPLPDPPEQDNG